MRTRFKEYFHKLEFEYDMKVNTWLMYYRTLFEVEQKDTSDEQKTRLLCIMNDIEDEILSLVHKMSLTDQICDCDGVTCGCSNLFCKSTNEKLNLNKIKDIISTNADNFEQIYNRLSKLFSHKSTNFIFYDDELYAVKAFFFTLVSDILSLTCDDEESVNNESNESIDLDIELKKSEEFNVFRTCNRYYVKFPDDMSIEPIQVSEYYNDIQNKVLTFRLKEIFTENELCLPALLQLFVSEKYEFDIDIDILYPDNKIAYIEKYTNALITNFSQGFSSYDNDKCLEYVVTVKYDNVGYMQDVE